MEPGLSVGEGVPWGGGHFLYRTFLPSPHKKIGTKIVFFFPQNEALLFRNRNQTQIKGDYKMGEPERPNGKK